MPVATSTALLISAGAGLLGTGASLYSAEKQRGMQKDSMRKQEQAQKEALASAASQKASSMQAMAAANRKAPDISAAMMSAGSLASRGVNSTLLSGPGGLGKNTLLGG
jgi:DNA replication protein DnaC